MCFSQSVWFTSPIGSLVHEPVPPSTVTVSKTPTACVGRLRRKLGAPPVITATPGVGYRIG